MMIAHLVSFVLAGERSVVPVRLLFVSDSAERVRVRAQSETRATRV